MQQITNYGDERTLAFCAFCGGETGTRDHCPSRVLLDEPLPENLPVVPACAICNNGFSADEEYLACLVSCVIVGSSDPDASPRAKIKRLLAAKPVLRARIEQARQSENNRTEFLPEHERIRRVMLKLARGHALYELHEPRIDEPTEFICVPLSALSVAQRDEFETPSSSSVWPEVGSRAMQRLVEDKAVRPDGWIDVQPGRYRYCAQLSDGVDIRIVVHEYLACKVQWEF
jgi:hypothetical protein